MIDQAKASKLAREAFDLWQAGQHKQSRLLYEKAIPLADPQHYMLPSYYGEYACVLNVLGRHDEARTALEKALEVEIAQGNAEGSPSIIAARYFLADQLLRLGDPEHALEVLTPSIAHAPDSWLTRVEEAHILRALNRKADAKAAAAEAISYAPTREKAEQLRQILQEILDSPDMETR